MHHISFFRTTQFLLCGWLLTSLAVGRCAPAPGVQAPTGQAPPVVTPAVRKAPPYILIKADDLKATRNGDVHPLWKKFADFLRERKIKSSIGIICDSLEGDSPKYFEWIKAQQAGELVEFWNHGYDHKEWEEAGRKLQEFKGPTYEQQKEHLLRSNRLAKEKLGFALPAFGAPFNATDENTAKALAEDPDTTIWLYGDLKNPAGKVVLDRVGAVNIENPTFVPSLDKFKNGYARFPDREFFVIQGHPMQWNEERFAQFVQIIDFLLAEKAIFTTPSEYVKQVRDKAPAAAPTATGR